MRAIVTIYWAEPTEVAEAYAQSGGALWVRLKNCEEHPTDSQGRNTCSCSVVLYGNGAWQKVEYL